MFGCIGLLGLNGCNDSFLERYPETSITEDGFFNNASDLEAYTNGLYGNITSGYTDVPSDNMIYTESQNIYSMMRGEVNPDNQSTWDWEKIRDVNFLLSRAGKAQGDTTEINHYVGLARMFRAKCNYDEKKNVVIAYLLYNRYRYGNGSNIQSDRESLVGRGWRSGYWCDCNGEGNKHWNCD